MENLYKNYTTKSIKWENHKEFMELSNAVDDNDKNKVMDILIKLFREGRLKW